MYLAFLYNDVSMHRTASLIALVSSLSMFVAINKGIHTPSIVTIITAMAAGTDPS